MRQATIRLKLVTRTYLGGSDPRTSDPELRVPSIRGLLRYWLRAAAGAVYHDIGHMRAIEETTFGSVKQGGPVAISLALDPRPTLRSAAYEPQSQGQRYLYWSMKSSDNDQWRKAFQAGGEFALTLTQRGNTPTTRAAFERALAALWLLTHLGGVGARSRRGAGSLAPLPNSQLPPDLPQPFANLPFEPVTSADALRARLRAGISAARDLMVDPDIAPSPPTTQPPFDVLIQRFCRIWVLPRPQGGSWYTADIALNNLGASLSSYRKTIKPRDKRAAFGLPITDNPAPDLTVRRASPLLLRISAIAAPTGRTDYVAVATLFKSQFQPLSDQPLSPEYWRIERWITDSLRVPRELEVEL